MNRKESVYRKYIVTSVTQETEDARSFDIRPADGIATPYQAGQFITLVFQKKDGEDRRSYSFSSAPLLNEPMRITVKRIANGEYSRHLVNHVKPGDILLSAGISGFFRLPEKLAEIRQIVFLAAGSGITPIYSLLKTLLHKYDLPVFLICSNYAERDTIFYKELMDLSARFNHRLRVEFLFSQSETTRRRLSKFLLQALLEQHTIPLKETLFYLCGPSNYMLTASISLITAGVPDQHIRKENFNTQKHTVNPVPPDTDAHKVTLFLNNKWEEFMVQYPDTILSAAKKLNIPLPYSCEAGNCGSCAATCIEGSTWMAYNEVLMDDEIKKGKVLTCQGYPVAGNIKLLF